MQTSWLQCGRCYLFLPCELEWDQERKAATVAMKPHDDCNPEMARFFNEESQHFRPFTR